MPGGHKLSREEELRRFVARMSNAQTTKMFVAWAQHVQRCRSAREQLALLRPDVDAALMTRPSQRVAADIDSVRGLIADLPFAQNLPPEAITMCCKAASYEILHEDMVLPRHTEDLEAAFVVLSGTVQLAFGALGDYAFSRTRQRTIRESTAGALSEPNGGGAGSDVKRGSEAAVDDAAQQALVATQASRTGSGCAGSRTVTPLSQLGGATCGAGQREQDASEARRRAASHAFFSPDAFRHIWGTANARLRAQQAHASRVPLVPVTTPRTPHDGSDTARDSIASGQTGDGALDAEVDAALEALCNDAETVKQVAVLSRGQMFTGPKLKGWSNMIALWPPPVQAHVSRAFECPYATVLVLPKQALKEAIQAAEQMHVQRMIDACCRVPAFRHMPLSGIAGLARHCREERLPKQHELLRQGHAITHVFLLLEGSVEVTAATAAADAALLHPDTLADTSGHAPLRVPSLVTYPSTFELPGAASLSSKRSLEPVPSLAPAESLPSAPSLGDRKVKVRLGVQSAPCVLGDDPLRGPSGSFVSVITATPCRVAVIALNRFKSSVEGVTRHLFERLRRQHQQMELFDREVSSKPVYTALQKRNRAVHLSAVYGERALPAALCRAPVRRPPSWRPPRPCGIPPLPAHDPVAQPPSPQTLEATLASLTERALHGIVHARPGLPALVLRLKSDVTFAASASFSEFARSVLTQAVSRDLDDAEVAAHVAAAAAAGGVATSANDVAEVAQRLRRFGCGLAQETRPATPILKRIRTSSVWDRHSRTKLDGLPYTFRSMQNDRVKAARGERGAVVLAHCAVAVVTLVAVPGQCGATAEHCAGVMDEALAKWSEASSKHQDLHVVRTNGKCFTVVRQAGTEPDERRAAVNALCGLALDFAHGFTPSARDGPKHWVRIALSQGGVTCDAHHSHFWLDLGGLAVRNAEALLRESALRDAHGSALLATDAVLQQVEQVFLCKPLGAGAAVLARRPHSDLKGRQFALMETQLDAASTAGVDAASHSRASSPSASDSTASDPPGSRGHACSSNGVLRQHLRTRALAELADGASEGTELEGVPSVTCAFEMPAIELGTASHASPTTTATEMREASLRCQSVRHELPADARTSHNVPPVSTQPHGRPAIQRREGSSPIRAADARQRGGEAGVWPAESAACAEHCAASDGGSTLGGITAHRTAGLIAVLGTDTQVVTPVREGCVTAEHTAPGATPPASSRSSLEAPLDVCSAACRAAAGSAASTPRGLDRCLQGSGVFQTSSAVASQRSAVASPHTSAARSGHVAFEPMERQDGLHRVPLAQEKGAVTLLPSALAVLPPSSPLPSTGQHTMYDAAQSSARWPETGGGGMVSSPQSPRVAACEQTPASNGPMRRRRGPCASATPSVRAEQIAAKASRNALIQTGSEAAPHYPKPGQLHTAVDVRRRLRHDLAGDALMEKRQLAVEVVQPEDCPGALPSAGAQAAERTVTLSFAGCGRPAGRAQQGGASTAAGPHLDAALATMAAEYGTGSVVRQHFTGKPRKVAALKGACGAVPQSVSAAAKDHAVPCAVAWCTEHPPRGQLHVECTGHALSAWPELGQPNRIQSLALSFNRLSLLPDVRLTALQTLNVAYNQLATLPSGIAQFAPNLKDVNFEGNRLQSLPESFAQLSNLHTLNVSHNELKSLPASLGGLQSCWQLDVSDNELAGLPASLSMLTSLSELNVSNNAIAGIPDWLLELTGLQDLRWAGNGVHELEAHALAQLTELTYLDLSRNNLTTFDLVYETPEGGVAPSVVEELALQGLRADGTLIDATALQGVHIPELEGDADGFGSGDAAGAQTCSHFAALGPLPGCLRVLDLRCNRLVRVPPSLPASLETLFLGGNWVCELPRWLPGRLPKLEVLDVHMNNVLYVHRDVFAMPALQTLALAQNPALRGSGRLAQAIRSGAGVGKLRGIANGMTAAQWRAELESLRRVSQSV